MLSRSVVLCALALGLCGCATHTIPVRIGVDAGFRQRPYWKQAVIARVAAASKIYEAQADLKWRVTEVVEWTPASDIADDQRVHLRVDVPRAPSEILLGIRSAPGRRGSRTFGSTTPFTDAMVVMDYQGESDDENVRILAHQLAHLFGAFHQKDCGCLMDDFASTATLDPVTRQTIRETRDFPFQRGLAHLDDRSREAILAFYTARLPAGVTNPRPKALDQLGNLLASDGENDRALAAYDESLRADPTDAFTLYDRGKFLVQLSRLDEAIDSLRRAEKLRPALAEVHEELGIALSRQTRIAEARTELLRAIELEPRRASAHFQLGVVLSRDPRMFQTALAVERGAKAELDQAEERALDVVERDPSNESAHFSLGASRLLLGKCREAVVSLERALELNPKLGDAQTDLAAAEYCIGNYAEARKRAVAGKRLGSELPASFLSALDQVDKRAR